MNKTLAEIIAKTVAETSDSIENLTEEVLAAGDEAFSLTCYSLWGFPTPPIAILRANGVKCYVSHSRWIKGKGIHRTKEFIAQGLSGKDFEPRGGRTDVSLVFPDGETLKGKSVCVKKDSFNRLEGLYLAVSDALGVK